MQSERCPQKPLSTCGVMDSWGHGFLEQGCEHRRAAAWPWCVAGSLLAIKDSPRKVKRLPAHLSNFSLLPKEACLLEAIFCIHSPFLLFPTNSD